MMETAALNQNGAAIPRDRLGLKLLGLFFGVFLVAFLVLLAYGVLGSYMESQLAGSDVVLQPPPINVDANIEKELSTVLAFNEAPSPADVRDPFIDRGGISDVPAAGTATSAQIASGSNGTAANPSGSGPSTAGNSGSVSASAGSGPASAPPSPIEATKRRYDAWLERARFGADAKLDARIFSIEDLQPVGIVDGGNGVQEVLFYSEAIDKTMSFPVGTQFFDGWLSGLRPEGVVFSFNDSRRTVRMRSWVRSLRASS